MESKITIVGESNKDRLRKVNTLLERILSDEEQDRIERHNIAITISASPSSMVSCKTNPLKDLQLLNLIFLEIKFYREFKENPQQLAAVLLHEMGHVLNPPPNDKNTPQYREFYADDYVRYCNFAPPLIKNLEECLKKPHLSSEIENIDLSKKRISRIQNNDDLLLNLQKLT